jgi:hypothetical protein
VLRSPHGGKRTIEEDSMKRLNACPIAGVAALACAVALLAGAANAPARDQALSGGGKVKVVIAGTNDRYPVTDGSLAGTGTFTARGAITDKGIALGYRTVTRDFDSPNGALITLRYVTKGKKGTITYVVKIDTKAETARWTIASGTKAYKGLYGRGTESENASFTVSTLTGTVWR